MKSNVITEAVKRSSLYLNTRPYYRRFPRKSKTRLSWIDSRGAVDFETNLFFSRIPNSANSFVLLEIYKFRTTEQATQQVVKKKFLKPSEMNSQQLSVFENLFKFTIVRNPYARTLSAYLDKVVRMNRPIKKISRTRIPSFVEFCRYLDRGGLHDNIHWAPQTSIILLPADRFDYIGRVETLDRDLPLILSHGRDLTGRTSAADFVPGEVPSKFYRTPNADNRMAEHYDAETREIVARLFADDFRVFDYPIAG